MDPLDGLEVRLAATVGEHPACDGREISQRAIGSLSVAFRIATRTGPVLVEESVRPSLGVLPRVHAMGIGEIAVLAEDGRAHWTLGHPPRTTAAAREKELLGGGILSS